MIKYTQSHEWIRVEGSVGTVGITEHAKNELGDIVHVELPKVERSVQVGDEVCVLESTKAAADIYSPISGTIIAVHEDLKASPQRISASPEKEGWLFKMEIKNLKDLDTLLTKEQYEESLQSS